MLFEGAAAITVWRNGVPKDSIAGFFGLLFNWDSGWFACIARGGYVGHCPRGVAVAPRSSFFPAYPFLARVLGVPLGALTSDPVTAAMWSIVFVSSFVAALLLYGLVRRTEGVRAARVATALLLLGPYGMFLVASYSEAMFLALAIGSWYAASTRHYAVAGLLAAGASLTRINGVFLVAGLVVLCVQQEREKGGRAEAGDLAWLAAGLSGTIAFFLWLGRSTGDFTAWLTSERRSFHRRTKWPWQTLETQLRLLSLKPPFRPHADQRMFELIAAVVLLVVIVWFVRRRDWASSVYVFISTAALVTSTDYQSLARTSLVIFPAFIAGGVVLAGRSRWVSVAVFALCIGIGSFNDIQFALGHWAD